MILKNARVFISFLWRDWHCKRKHLGQWIINFTLLYPALYCFCFGYVKPRILFPNNPDTMSTILLMGPVFLMVLIVTFDLSLDLLLDLDEDRFTEYQTLILSPRLYLLERLTFSTLFTFGITAPFMPIAKFILGSHLATPGLSWPQYFLILFTSSLACSAYHICAMCILTKSSQLMSLWTRITFIFSTFGGFWVPRAVLMSFIAEYSSWAHYLVFINPFVYITDGLRGATIGGSGFISPLLCALVLVGFTVITMLFAAFFFKRKLDHV